MKKKQFTIILEKEKYFTGEITIDASSEAEARQIASDWIANCQLTTMDVEWDDGEYSDNSFGLSEVICKSDCDVCGDFISTWDDGSSIETIAILGADGIFVNITPSTDTSDHGCLVSEEFISPETPDSSHKFYTVCPDCHGAILKYSINGDTVLEEDWYCADEACGYGHQ
jgi:hypothetical protein